MSRCRSWRYFGLVAVLMSVFAVLQAHSLRAQVSASGVSGVVTDSSGAVVLNATVKITSKTTTFTRTATTDSAGVFSIGELNVGSYSITVEAPGFKTVMVPDVTLYVGQLATQNITLQVGETVQSVTVSAEAPLLNTTSGTVGTVIVSTFMTELPLNGRNFLQLNLLSPGASHDKSGATPEAYDINPSNTAFSVNGQRSDFNLYILDGTVFKDYVFGTSPIVPSVDAVQEFQTETGNYSAAFGSEAGAQVNLVTKSGTNGLHGTAWEYLRNNVFDARNFFQQGATPPFRRNQFGGNIGGPVVIPKIYNGKDHTFFFFNYEGFRQVKSVPTLENFPTPAELSGNLSALVQPGTALIDPTTGKPFPGNIIPANRIPSTLETFLQNGIGNGPWIPLPNSTVPGANYFANVPTNYFSNQYVVRIDQRIGNKTFIYGSFVDQHESALNPPTIPGLLVGWNPNYSINTTKQAHTLAIHFNRTITPNMVFDFGFGWSGFEQEVVQSTAGKYDITGSILQMQGLSTNPGAWGAPSWGVAGFSNMGEQQEFPLQWPLSIYQYTPGLTLVKGKHSMKFGVQILRDHYNFQQIYAATGDWSFDGTLSGYGLGDFLLGLPASIVVVKSPFSPVGRDTAFAPYFQDDWRVTPNLTLDLGFRYEYGGLPYSSNNTFANTYFGPNHAVPELVVPDNYRPVTYQGVTYPLVPGVPFVTASSVGLPQHLTTFGKLNLAPRFGFAYRIPGTSNTVVRGGYGIYYQKDQLAALNSLAVNPPFVGGYIVTNDASNFNGFDWFNPLGNTPASQIAFQAVQTNYRQAMSQQWNLTLERSMWSTLFSAAYVGNTDHHLPDIEFPNQALPGPGPLPPRRPWPTVGTINMEGFNGNSNYNGLQLKVQRDFSKGLTLLAGYTWSKSIDNTAGSGQNGDDLGPNAPQDAYNWQVSDRALSGQDIRNRFVTSFVYELPFGRGKAFLDRGGALNALLGGWQVNGIVTLANGSPLTALETFNSENFDSGNRRPDQICNPNRLSHSRPTGEQVLEFFDTSCFQQASLYTYGSAGRNSIIGPGVKTVDGGIAKNFQLKEGLILQFRAEAFNLFNHPDFAQPGQTLGTPQFGEITATAIDNREGQLSLRLTF
jgi:hypothetical protein